MLECQHCGEHWYPITSEYVVGLTYDMIRVGLEFAIYDDVHFSKYGDAKYSLEHTYVSCSGDVRLGVVGLPREAQVEFLRWWNGDEFDESEMEAYFAERFPVVGRGERLTLVPLGQVFVLLLENWNDRQSTQTRNVSWETFDSESLSTLGDVMARLLPAQACLGLQTVRCIG